MKRLMLLAALLLLPTAANATKVSFIEAAVYFLTAVEPTEAEVLSEYSIALKYYPIRAYLLDGDPCMVRIRTTTQPLTVWQMKFCHVTGYQWSPDNVPTLTGGSFTFFGADEERLFCQGRLAKDEDYMGVIPYDFCLPVFPGVITIDSLLKKQYPMRSQARLLDSFKYIAKILTPREQRKPY